MPDQTYQVQVQITETGSEEASTRVQNLGFSALGASRAITILQSNLGSLVGASSLSDIENLLDRYSQMRNEVEFVSSSHEEAAQAMESLMKVANASRTTIEDTTESFFRFSIVTQELGLSQKDTLRIVQTLNEEFQISGASSRAAAASIQQFAAALEKGQLSSRQFLTFARQAPLFLKDLAESFGDTVGAFEAAAQGGEISTQDLLNAIVRLSAGVDDKFNALPLTITQSLNLVHNSFFQFLEDLEKSGHLIEGTNTALGFLAQHMTLVGSAVIGLLATGGLLGLIALLTLLTPLIGAVGVTSAIVLGGVTALGVGLSVAAEGADKAKSSFDDLTDSQRSAYEQLFPSEAAMEKLKSEAAQRGHDIGEALTQALEASLTKGLQAAEAIKRAFPGFFENVGVPSALGPGTPSPTANEQLQIDEEKNFLNRLHSGGINATTYNGMTNEQVRQFMEQTKDRSQSVPNDMDTKNLEAQREALAKLVAGIEDWAKAYENKMELETKEQGAVTNEVNKLKDLQEGYRYTGEALKIYNAEQKAQETAAKAAGVEVSALTQKMKDQLDTTAVYNLRLEETQKVMEQFDASLPLNTMQILNQEFKEGTITLEQYAGAFARAKEEANRASQGGSGKDTTTSLDDLIKEGGDESKHWGELEVQILKDIGKAQDDLLNKTKIDWRQMADNIVQSLLKIEEQALLTQAATALINAGGGSGSGSLLSGAGKLVGALAGALAGGGEADAGRSYLVGEHGPEIFTPTGSGVVTPNGVGISAPDVHVHVVNVSDKNELSDYLQSSEGGQHIINQITKNRQTINAALQR